MHMNSIGSDQPAHLHSLANTFFVHTNTQNMESDNVSLTWFHGCGKSYPSTVCSDEQKVPNRKYRYACEGLVKNMDLGTAWGKNNKCNLQSYCEIQLF